ncbi:MAG: hypothetical protein HUU21_33865 [Polyangiaceae bacterium]|nr:hypothetical protein [Polyangiaceae bacterium]
MDLTSAAIKLSAQIQQFEIASQEALEPHADFMATHGAAMPDMTSAAQRSLNAMLGYIQRRVARSDATATALVIGVGTRRKALQMLAGSSDAARAQIASAKLEKASSVFVGTSDAHVSAMKTALPINKNLGRPYLAKRYDELTKILQMQPLPNEFETKAGLYLMKDQGRALIVLEALEAAAVPDDEWRAVEPLALEHLAAIEQGASVVEVDVTSKKHRHFIEQHAPYHVRRLPNGGVMLATHPYRTLWPLWADALDLLGIRKNE